MTYNISCYIILYVRLIQVTAHGAGEDDMRENIIEINTVAQTNFDIAEGMLYMLNKLCGTNYGWFNKRVVRFENPNGSAAERYANFHDAVAELTE